MKRFSFLFIFLLFLSAVQAQKADIALRLGKGKTYQSKSVAEATIDQDVMGQSMSIHLVITGVKDFTVTGKTNDFYDLQVQYRSLSMDLKMPQASMTFSSETPNDSEPVSGVLARLKSSPFQLRLSSKGKVLQVTGMDSLFRSAFENISGIPEDQLQQLKKQVTDAYGEKVFKESLETSLAVFPDGKVKPGDSWQREVNMESGMSAVLSIVYTYNGEEDGYYLVHGEGKIVTDDKKPDLQPNGMNMKFDFNGSLVADLKVDRKTGWIASGLSAQEVSGFARIEGNPQMPQGMEIPMSMKINTTYSGK